MNKSDAEHPQPDQFSLVTKQGRTSISEMIVAKLAAIATREIDGVYRLAGGGTFPDFLAGGSTFPDFTQRIGNSSAIEGVQAEVGLRETAIDLRLITEYGASIPDVAHAVRQNIIARVMPMTGLIIKEVNIDVVDLHFPSEGRSDTRTDTDTHETVRL